MMMVDTKYGGFHKVVKKKSILPQLPDAIISKHIFKQRLLKLYIN